MGFADAHLHPTEGIDGTCYPDLGSAGLLFGCCARESEWGAMSSLGDRRLVRFYGVHPWYAEEWSPRAGESLRAVLESDQHANVGEIGLDPNRGDPAAQMRAFEAQLELAEGMDRIVNVHCVGPVDLVLRALRGHRRVTAVIHAFSDESRVRPLAELGCRLSVNPRILRRSPARVARLIGAIPEDRLLLESDAPFTPGFAGMGDFANKLASAVGSDADTIMGIARDNAGAML